VTNTSVKNKEIEFTKILLDEKLVNISVFGDATFLSPHFLLIHSQCDKIDNE